MMLRKRSNFSTSTSRQKPVNASFVSTTVAIRILRSLQQPVEPHERQPRGKRREDGRSGHDERGDFRLLFFQDHLRIHPLVDLLEIGRVARVEIIGSRDVRYL